MVAVEVTAALTSRNELYCSSSPIMAWDTRNWITVRVRSLRVRSMIDRATSVERRRLPVMASG